MFEGRNFSSKLQLQNITKSTNIELQKIITYKKTCQAILFEKVLVAHAFISLGFFGNYACVLESGKMASPPKFQPCGILCLNFRNVEKKNRDSQHIFDQLEQTNQRAQHFWSLA